MLSKLVNDHAIGVQETNLVDLFAYSMSRCYKSNVSKYKYLSWGICCEEPNRGKLGRWIGAYNDGLLGRCRAVPGIRGGNILMKGERLTNEHIFEKTILRWRNICKPTTHDEEDLLWSSNLIRLLDSVVEMVMNV
jgi:hypothetical protein